MLIKKLLIIILLLFIASPIFAQRGCCSWHQGVCGCSNLGVTVCCDGMYSPTCTCVPPVQYQQQYYTPKYVPPPPPQFPQLNANFGFYSNENGTYNVEVKLQDPSPTRYSAVISKCVGCDPGPTSDFNTNQFLFWNIKTGRWYVNMKKDINNVWSTVSYLTVDVPEWVAPTPTPLVAITYPTSVDPTPISFFGWLIARFKTP